MELTPRIRCGLRVMVALAVEPLRPASLNELAQKARAPLSLIRNALGPLEQARLVQRVDGGYRLGFQRRAIHISDIIDALRTELYPATCPLGACKPEARCQLCWSLVEAEVAASEVLHRQTLADIVVAMGAQTARLDADLAG